MSRSSYSKLSSWMVVSSKSMPCKPWQNLIGGPLLVHRAWWWPVFQQHLLAICLNGTCSGSKETMMNPTQSEVQLPSEGKFGCKAQMLPVTASCYEMLHLTAPSQRKTFPSDACRSAWRWVARHNLRKAWISVRKLGKKLPRPGAFALETAVPLLKGSTAIFEFLCGILWHSSIFNFSAAWWHYHKSKPFPAYK